MQKCEMSINYIEPFLRYHNHKELFCDKRTVLQTYSFTPNKIKTKSFYRTCNPYKSLDLTALKISRYWKFDWRWIYRRTNTWFKNFVYPVHPISNLYSSLLVILFCMNRVNKKLFCADWVMYGCIECSSYRS